MAASPFLSPGSFPIGFRFRILLELFLLFGVLRFVLRGDHLRISAVGFAARWLAPTHIFCGRIPDLCGVWLSANVGNLRRNVDGIFGCLVSSTLEMVSLFFGPVI